MISYDKLWELIYQRRLYRSTLAERCGVSRNTMARMKEGKPVSLDVIDRICLYLDCNIEDVIEIIKED